MTIITQQILTVLGKEEDNCISHISKVRNIPQLYHEKTTIQQPPQFKVYGTVVQIKHSGVTGARVKHPLLLLDRCSVTGAPR